MKNYLSERVTNSVKIPGLFEIYGLALEMQRAGKEIIHMEIGRPDFDTPQKIKAAAQKALEDGIVYYSEPAGILELRKAVSLYTKRISGVDYDPASEILITVGASEALDLIWAAFLDDEDEVMIPSPYYGAYTFQLDYAGKKYVKVPILKEGGKLEYKLEDFEAKLTPNTKMILINSPNNPTGYVMTDDEMNMIAEFAKKHDLIVISDECYDNYVFEGKFRSMASLPGMKERTLVLNSTSKTFAMTGWRVGHILGKSEFIVELLRIHAQRIICPTIFAQVGAATAYGEEILEVAMMRQAFMERKEYIADFLKGVKNVSYVEPKGAFYIFMDISKLEMSGFEFCEKLIQSKGVTLSPGNNFGLEWEGYVRISYACSLEEVKRAMTLIKEFVEENIK